MPFTLMVNFAKSEDETADKTVEIILILVNTFH